MTAAPLTEDDWRELMENRDDVARTPYEEFGEQGGFTVVETSAGRTVGSSVYGARDAGMTAHRGTVHPDEYVDHETVVAAIEEQLGHTFEEIRSVYGARLGGPVPDALRQLRDDLDSRMLALSSSGANMELLRRLLGLPRMTLTRAVARARGKQ